MLVPLRIKWRDPAGLGSADSPGACKCDDGCEYVLKDGRVHPATPHTEWFCTKLADAIGIACPPCAVIQDEHGGYLFGSRWEGGLPRDRWYDLVQRGDLDIAVLAPTISRIFAFDCFVQNDDRHLNNYLVRNSKNGVAMLAFDFSRAWRFHGFPPASLPLPTDSNTRKAQAFMARRLGLAFALDEAILVLDRISSVKLSTIENICQSQPGNWLSSVEINQTLTWWDSSLRSDRITDLRKGLGNGTYL